MFTFSDICSGIGGIRIALERQGGQCVFSSEINKECIKTYGINFGETPSGDISQIDPESVPEHDVLTAGFPCQPFSKSGTGKGFADTRGTIFFSILNIIRVKKPKIVLLENVKQLQYHDNKRTLQTILECLEQEGYLTSWQVLNAKDFGLAQNRERIIIIASKEQKFDFNQVMKSECPTIRDIMEESSNSVDPSQYTIIDKKLWKKQKTGLIFCGYFNKNIRKDQDPEKKHLSKTHRQQNRIYHIDGTHPTISSQESTGRFWIYNGQHVRKLTINECFRLMGFPDTYQKAPKGAAVYNQIGNSVPINMIEAVMIAIKNQKMI